VRPLVLAHDLGVSLPTVLFIVTLSFPMVPMASMCLFSYCVGRFPHVLTRVCTMCMYISRAAWGLTPQAICLTFILSILACCLCAVFYLSVTTFPLFRPVSDCFPGFRSYSLFRRPRHLPCHSHASSRHHLPTWLFFILILDY
jgi:hypothetical protein